MTDSFKSMQSRIAAHERWARTNDRLAATAPARNGFANRFEREVDPEGVLSPVERARRAESARKAYMLRLALKSAKARRARAEADRLDREVADELAEPAGGGL